LGVFRLAKIEKILRSLEDKVIVSRLMMVRLRERKREEDKNIRVINIHIMRKKNRPVRTVAGMLTIILYSKEDVVSAVQRVNTALRDAYYTAYTIFKLDTSCSNMQTVPSP
jgi:hypothetical protein